MAFVDLAGIIFTLSAIEVNLILIIVGLYLLINGIQKKMTNIIFLSVAFLLVGLSIFALVAFSLTLAKITITTYFGIALYAPFTYLTFHKGKESKSKQMMTIIGIFFIIKAYFGTLENQSSTYFIISQISTILVTATAASWYGYSALDASKKLKDQGVDVEHYLRKRLEIMGYVSYIYAIGVTIARILTIIFRTNTQAGTDIIGAMISLLVAFYLSVFAIGMLLTWMSPKWFKNYLNRDYVVLDIKKSVPSEGVEEAEFNETKEEEIEVQTLMKETQMDEIEGEHEAELIYQKEIEQIVKMGFVISHTFDMITFLGTILSKKINKSLIVSKGLIRVSISDKFPASPKYLKTDEWISVLLKHLPLKLNRIKISDADDVSRELVDELIRNQSLITVTAV